MSPTGLGEGSQGPHKPAKKKRNKMKNQNQNQGTCSQFQQEGSIHTIKATERPVTMPESRRAPSSEQGKGVGQKASPSAQAATLQHKSSSDVKQKQEPSHKRPSDSGAEDKQHADITQKQDGKVRIKIEWPQPHVWVFPKQPNPTAYGGLGFARPSTWLSLQDEDFVDAFAKVFKEHIDYGSTGKAFLKGFKREREANMLWRVKLREKLSSASSSSPGDSIGNDVVGAKRKRKDSQLQDERITKLGSSTSRIGSAELGVRQGGVSVKGKKEGDDTQEGIRLGSAVGTSKQAATDKQSNGGASTKGGDAVKAKSAKERVKARRSEAIASQRQVMPKVEINTLLQQSAIEAYRKLKQQRKDAAPAKGLIPGPQPGRRF